MFKENKEMKNIAGHTAMKPLKIRPLSSIILMPSAKIWQASSVTILYYPQTESAVCWVPVSCKTVRSMHFASIHFWSQWKEQNETDVTQPALAHIAVLAPNCCVYFVYIYVSASLRSNWCSCGAGKWKLAAHTFDFAKRKRWMKQRRETNLAGYFAICAPDV